jgi:hypothetical protein
MADVDGFLLPVPKRKLRSFTSAAEPRLPDTALVRNSNP